MRFNFVNNNANCLNTAALEGVRNNGHIHVTDFEILCRNSITKKPQFERIEESLKSMRLQGGCAHQLNARAHEK